MSVVTINATLQLLDIYRFEIIGKKKIKKKFLIFYF